MRIDDLTHRWVSTDGLFCAAEHFLSYKHPCARTNRLVYRGDFMFHDLVSGRSSSFKVRGNGLIWLSVLRRTILVIGTHVPGPTVWRTGAILCFWPCFRTSNSLEWSSNAKVMRCFDKCLMPNIFGHWHPCDRTKRLAYRNDFMFHDLVSGRRIPLQGRSRSKVMGWFD